MWVLGLSDSSFVSMVPLYHYIQSFQSRVWVLGLSDAAFDISVWNSTAVSIPRVGFRVVGRRTPPIHSAIVVSFQSRVWVLGLSDTLTAQVQFLSLNVSIPRVGFRVVGLR